MIFLFAGAHRYETSEIMRKRTRPSEASAWWLVWILAVWSRSVLIFWLCRDWPWCYSFLHHSFPFTRLSLRISSSSVMRWPPGSTLKMTWGTCSTRLDEHGVVTSRCACIYVKFWRSMLMNEIVCLCRSYMVLRTRSVRRIGSSSQSSSRPSWRNASLHAMACSPAPLLHTAHAVRFVMTADVLWCYYVLGHRITVLGIFCCW